MTLFAYLLTMSDDGCPVWLIALAMICDTILITTYWLLH